MCSVAEVLLNLAELVRKLFNPKNFKGIVSPHEFLHAVATHSKNQSQRIRV